MTWQRTGIPAASLTAGSMREASLGLRAILLAHVGTALVAVEGVCPHQGGVLIDGTLAERRITCPVHGAAFDVTTGAVLADPDGVEPPEGAVDPLDRFPVRVVAGEIEVDVP